MKFVNEKLAQQFNDYNIPLFSKVKNIAKFCNYLSSGIVPHLEIDGNYIGSFLEHMNVDMSNKEVYDEFIKESCKWSEEDLKVIFDNKYGLSYVNNSDVFINNMVDFYESYYEHIANKHVRCIHYYCEFPNMLVDLFEYIGNILFTEYFDKFFDLLCIRFEDETRGIRFYDDNMIELIDFWKFHFIEGEYED